jgi:NMD protein affecting ribosome stability and mRNA decay
MNKKKLNLSRPNYFQGILQLRDVTEKVYAFVKAQLDKRDDVAVTKTVKYPNGADLYLTSQKFVSAIGKKLKESFGGELKITSKLHTRSKTGKDLYRVTALYRPIKYKRGDIVNVRGEDVKLLQVGNRIFARVMKSGKKVKIRREDLPVD